jgi:hypothetical protein
MVFDCTRVILFFSFLSFVQVGAPPEIADVLDEIRRESDLCKRTSAASTRLGADLELDQFMVSLSLSL